MTMQVKASIFKKNGKTFRQIVKLPQMEWCSIMEGADTNMFMKILIDMLKEKAPTLVHKCPYVVSIDDVKIALRKLITYHHSRCHKGKVDINITFGDKPMLAFPPGEYKGEYNVTSSRKPILSIAFVNQRT